VLRLKPDEFWRMTPHDFYACIDGASVREDREMEKLAWLASTLMSAWIKKPPTVAQLLGRENSLSSEDHARNFAKVKVNNG
jgi:uncharacterized phage protein (TIGR02216 family)